MLIVLLTSLLCVAGAIQPAASSDLFDAMPTCKKDNWGLPKQTKKTFNGKYDKVLRIPCQEQFAKTTRPFSEAHDMATAIHYKDTPSYDTFQAVDWIPENKKLYSSGSSWGKPKNTDFKSKKPRSFMSAECNLANDDGSRWAITRIGPIVTTGGYDWLQIGWDDIWELKDALQTHKDGVYVVEQVISPVWANGTMINHPPIHIHHMHVGPAPYVRQRFDQLGCATRGKGCFNPARTLENHGDYNCVGADGGLECRMESFPEGFAKLIQHELGFEGELNDVRPGGSEPMEWYFQMGARWIPKDASTSADLAKEALLVTPNSLAAQAGAGAGAAQNKAATAATATTAATTGATKKGLNLKAMSLENIAGPGTYSLFHQKEYLLTFPTPTRYESIFWYTGRMQSKGDLLRMKVHAHNSIFEEALFFSAAPEDLGLTEKNGFLYSKPYLTVPTASVQDFKSNADAKKFLMRNLAASQSIYDMQHKAPFQGTPFPPDHKGCGYPDAACVVGRPEIICQVHGAVEVVPEPAPSASKTATAAGAGTGTTATTGSGSAVEKNHGLSAAELEQMTLAQNDYRAWYTDYAYDRRQPTCCVPWQWESGQVFTVVGFNKYKGYPVSGHTVSDEVPETLAGHVGFWMSYDEMASSPETFHWGYSLYNHYEDGSLRSVTDMKGYQKIAIAFNGGTSEHWNNSDKEPYYLMAYTIYLLLTHAPLVVFLLLLTLSCCCCGRLMCPRGGSGMRPLKLLSCNGLCDGAESKLAVALSPKPEKAYLTSSIRAEMVKVTHRAPRSGDDENAQEEKESFLA